METGWRYNSRIAVEWKWILKYFYPYSDCCIINYKLDAVRIGLANALEFILILQQPLSWIFNLFPFYPFPNFLFNFSLLISIPFLKITKCF